jgi:hypothetical protein
MKDRFVKVMLVIIAGLLFLNCVKDVSFTNSNSSTTSRNGSTQSPNPTKPSFIETSVGAAPAPSFIQVGKKYRFGESSYIYRVTAVDKESGWIKIVNEEGGYENWRNLNLILEVDEK